jgi:hypothetical protein
MSYYNPAFGQSTIGLSNDILTALAALNPNSVQYLNTINQSLGSLSSPSFNTVNLSGTLNVLDNKFNIKNATDQTKSVSFDLSAISTSTARTITMPDSSVNLTYVPNQGVSTTNSPQFAGLTINNKTPTDSQWSYITGFNQALATTSTPQFAKIGVNMAAATEALEIAGSAKLSTSLITNYGTGDFPNQKPHIILKTSNKARWDLSLTDAETGSGNVGSDLLVNNYDDAGALYLTPVRINRASGYLGLGVYPTERLTVNGNATISGTIFIPADSSVPKLLDFYTGAEGGSVGAYINGLNVPSHGWGLDFRAVDYNGGAFTDRRIMNLGPTGTVGIGQAAGTEMLEVSGNIKTASSGNIFICNSGNYNGIYDSPYFRIQTGGLDRWRWCITGDETGSDAGSNLILVGCHDNGNGFSTPFSIVRATGNAAFSGTINSNGIILPTSGGTATTLNYYETGSFVLTLDGPFSSSFGMTVYFTRIGNIATWRWGYNVQTGNNTSSAIYSASGTVPARLRPSAGQYCMCLIVRGPGAGLYTTPGIFHVLADGSIQVFVSTTSGFANFLIPIGDYGGLNEGTITVVLKHIL